MNRRDLLLNEMHIPQWVLRKPQVLRGNARIHLAESIKLVVICDEDYQYTPRFNDILRALKLTSTQYQWLNAEQAERLVFDHSPIFWQIGTQAVDFAKKFAKQTAWQTENWHVLGKSPHKRQFWQQIQPFLAEQDD